MRSGLMSAIDCVDRSVLQDFVSARLSRLRFDQVAAHLETCETCLAVLETLPQSPRPQFRSVAVSQEDAQIEAIESAAIQKLVSRLVRLPKASLATESGNSALSPGVIVGDFVLEQRLGEGSFGEVWKATDTRLRRAVAIKLTRHQGSNASGNDFEREARAAAQLDHPAIVRVFDVGKWNQSVYIVSEFVDGQSLQTATRGVRWTSQQTAECCEVLARGLAHAHERGVIHRDLKPANVLLDQMGRPRILDFGLARLGSEQTIAVEGWLLGTPAYMSPEQARGQAQLVGPETDVYSLGVMLFELLTGERPFRGDRESILAQTINVTAPTARSLNRQVPKDLDTLCSKCLEKEPRLRFRSAAELADELRRHLDHQPILSRPVGVSGKVWRWCLRKPWIATLSSSLAATALIASFLVTWSWRNERGARFDERTAKRLAERRLQSAEEAITDLVHLAEGIRELPGGQRRGQQVLQRVIDHYRQMTDATLPADPIQQRDVAHVWLNLAEIEQARNDFVASRHAAEKALAIFQSLRQQLAVHDDAVLGLATVQHRLGLLHSATQQFVPAVAELHRGRELLDELSDLNAEQHKQRVSLAATIQFDLGLAQFGLKRFELAEESLSQSRRDWDQLVKLDSSNRRARLNQINSLRVLGRIRNARNQTDQATKAIEEASRLAQTWNESAPDDAELVELHASTMLDAADVVRRRGHFAAERSLLSASREKLRKLLELENHSPRVHLELTLTITQLAQLQHRAGMNHSAKELIEEAWDRASELAALFPQVPDYSQTLAICSDIQGEILLDLGDAERAAELHRSAIELFRGMIAAAPDVPDLKQRLAVCHSNLGQALGHLQQRDDSQAAFQQAIESLDQLARQFADQRGYRESLADVVMEAGLAAAAAQQLPEAKTLLDRATQLRRELATEELSSPENLRQLVWLLSSNPLTDARHTQEALSLAEKLWLQERGHEPALCVSALALFRAGNVSAAQIRLREQLELISESADANRLLSALLFASANEPELFESAFHEGVRWHLLETPNVVMFDQLRHEAEQAAKAFPK